MCSRALDRDGRSGRGRWRRRRRRWRTARVGGQLARLKSGAIRPRPRARRRSVRPGSGHDGPVASGKRERDRDRPAGPAGHDGPPRTPARPPSTRRRAAAPAVPGRRCSRRELDAGRPAASRHWRLPAPTPHPAAPGPARGPAGTGRGRVAVAAAPHPLRMRRGSAVPSGGDGASDGRGRHTGSGRRTPRRRLRCRRSAPPGSYPPARRTALGRGHRRGPARRVAGFAPPVRTGGPRVPAGPAAHRLRPPAPPHQPGPTAGPASRAADRAAAPARPRGAVAAPTAHPPLGSGRLPARRGGVPAHLGGSSALVVVGDAEPTAGALAVALAVPTVLAAAHRPADHPGARQRAADRPAACAGRGATSASGSPSASAGWSLTIPASILYVAIVGQDATSAVGEVFGGIRAGPVLAGAGAS